MAWLYYFKQKTRTFLLYDLDVQNKSLTAS